jgi:hypothetical protein
MPAVVKASLLHLEPLEYAKRGGIWRGLHTRVDERYEDFQKDNVITASGLAGVLLIAQ